MALREIRLEGDPVLTKECRNVKELTERQKVLIEDMLETMYDAPGVGLAGPQIAFQADDIPGPQHRGKLGAKAGGGVVIGEEGGGLVHLFSPVSHHPTLFPSPSRGERRRTGASVFIVSLPLVGRDQGWG